MLPFKSGVHRVILFACPFCNERLLKCTERTHCTAGLHTKLGSLLQKLKRYGDAMEHFRLALRFGLVWLGATNHMTTLYVIRPCSSHYGWGGGGGGGGGGPGIQASNLTNTTFYIPHKEPDNLPNVKSITHLSHAYIFIQLSFCTLEKKKEEIF